MRPEDPLERAFECLKADPTGSDFNPTLETKLMNELHKQTHPVRWKRAALALAALAAVALAGGGIATAAGYRPFGQFLFTDDSGNAIDFQMQNAVQNADGTITMTGTVGGANAGATIVVAEFVPSDGNK